MQKLVILFVLCCIVVAAFARLPRPPSKCKSRVWGPTCSDYNPCKPGYDCIKGRCCRQPVCPKGWTGGPSCNTRPDTQRCQFRYQCINDFCCRPPPSGDRCPPLGRKPQCHLIRPGNVCFTPSDCPPGRICCPYHCGFKTCRKPWNPFGGPIGK